MGGGKGRSGSLRSGNPAFCGHLEAKDLNRAPIFVLNQADPIGDASGRADHPGELGHLGRRDPR